MNHTATKTELQESAPPVLAMRLKRAALALDVSERWLWARTQDQTVPCVRVGGTVLYDVDALRGWLASQGEKNRTSGFARRKVGLQ